MSRITICIPGDTFTGGFIDSWTETIFLLGSEGYEISISRAESSSVSHARLQCLGVDEYADEIRLFRGNPYDWILWLDSDMHWKAHDVLRLLWSAESNDVHIMSGCYRIRDGIHVAISKGAHQFYRADQLPLLKVSECHYAGMGFMLVKAGVFEALQYPYFSLLVDGRDLYSEDASFCVLARRMGYKTYFDPAIFVNHEKRIRL